MSPKPVNAVSFLITWHKSLQVTLSENIADIKKPTNNIIFDKHLCNMPSSVKQSKGNLWKITDSESYKLLQLLFYLHHLVLITARTMDIKHRFKNRRKGHLRQCNCFGDHKWKWTERKNKLFLDNWRTGRRKSHILHISTLNFLPGYSRQRKGCITFLEFPKLQTKSPYRWVTACYPAAVNNYMHPFKAYEVIVCRWLLLLALASPDHSPMNFPAISRGNCAVKVHVHLQNRSLWTRRSVGSSSFCPLDCIFPQGLKKHTVPPTCIAVTLALNMKCMERWLFHTYHAIYQNLR